MNLDSKEIADLQGQQAAEIVADAHEQDEEAIQNIILMPEARFLFELQTMIKRSDKQLWDSIQFQRGTNQWLVEERIHQWHENEMKFERWFAPYLIKAPSNICLRINHPKGEGCVDRYSGCSYLHRCALCDSKEHGAFEIDEEGRHLCLTWRGIKEEKLRLCEALSPVGLKDMKQEDRLRYMDQHLDKLVDQLRISQVSELPPREHSSGLSSVN